MLDVMVAINAAEFLVFGYSANRAINHSEHSNRKIDLSAGGGINSGGWSAAELRRRVAAQMGDGGSTGPGEWDEMAPQDEIAAVVWEQINRPEHLQSVANVVWANMIADRPAYAALDSAAKNAEWAAGGVTSLPTDIWTKTITDETAAVLLARAAE
jgi:hypothetical protein